MHISADSRFVPSQWEMSLQDNAVSDWLGAILESALHVINPKCDKGKVTMIQTSSTSFARPWFKGVTENENKDTSKN